MFYVFIWYLLFFMSQKFKTKGAIADLQGSIFCFCEVTLGPQSGGIGGIWCGLLTQNILCELGYEIFL